MDFNLLIENESFSCLVGTDEESIYRMIDILDELIETALKSKDTILSDRNIYYSEIAENIDFASWIFSTENDSPRLKEKKILFLKILEQSSKVNDEEYNEIRLEIKNQNSNSPNYENRHAFICLFAENKTEWYISSIDEWSILHRLYLGGTESINEFMRYIEPCFLNIFFHDNVNRSMKTLNQDFNDIKNEIIFHLKELNGFILDVEGFRNNITDGYRNLAKEFMVKSGIDCSPQSSRENTENLKAHFLNNKGESEELCCELHTKFTTYNADPEKQDRIYFHPGKDNIQDGKILIYHIGKHM